MRRHACARPNAYRRLRLTGQVQEIHVKSTTIGVNRIVGSNAAPYTMVVQNPEVIRQHLYGELIDLLLRFRLWDSLKRKNPRKNVRDIAHAGEVPGNSEWSPA